MANTNYRTLNDIEIAGKEKTVNSPVTADRNITSVELVTENFNQQLYKNIEFKQKTPNGEFLEFNIPVYTKGKIPQVQYLSVDPNKTYTVSTPYSPLDLQILPDRGMTFVYKTVNNTITLNDVYYVHLIYAGYRGYIIYGQNGTIKINTIEASQGLKFYIGREAAAKMIITMGRIF